MMRLANVKNMKAKKGKPIAPSNCELTRNNKLMKNKTS